MSVLDWNSSVTWKKPAFTVRTHFSALISEKRHKIYDMKNPTANLLNMTAITLKIKLGKYPLTIKTKKEVSATKLS